MAASGAEETSDVDTFDQRPLTIREQRFVAEYLIDRAAGAAYRRAGFRPRNDHTASSCASRLLLRPDIRSAIATAEAERARRTGITADRVLQELAAVALSSIDDYEVVGDGRVVLRNGAAADAIRAVSAVRRKTRSDDDGVTTETELKLWSKTDALKLCMQHLGMLKNDQPAPPLVSVNVQVDLTKLTDEQLDQLERLQAAASVDGAADSDRAGTVPPPA